MSSPDIRAEAERETLCQVERMLWAEMHARRKWSYTRHEEGVLSGLSLVLGKLRRGEWRDAEMPK